jgi:hypothetical protein
MPAIVGFAPARREVWAFSSSEPSRGTNHADTLTWDSLTYDEINFCCHKPISFCLIVMEALEN